MSADDGQVVFTMIGAIMHINYSATKRLVNFRLNIGIGSDDMNCEPFASSCDRLAIAVNRYPIRIRFVCKGGEKQLTNP